MKCNPPVPNIANLFLLAMALLILPLATVKHASAAEKPNIVMIISDDQAWMDYGFMGHPHIKTPHLDKLASQSLTFTHGAVR